MRHREGRALLLAAVSLALVNVARADGTLAYVEESSFKNAQGSTISISPDGAYVYASGHCGCTQADPKTSLTVFRRDAETGRLEFVQQMGDVAFASSHALSPDGAHLYAGSLTILRAFARDPSTGMVTLLASYEGGSGGIADLIRVGRIVVSADGAHVYVGGARIVPQPGGSIVVDAVLAFARDETTGLLTFVGSEIAGLDEVSGIRELDIAPDGGHLYLASAPDTLHVFERDPSSGILTLATSYVDGMGGINGLGGIASVVVSPDGAQVYTRSIDDFRLVTFARDVGTGALTPIQSFPPFGSGQLERGGFSPDGTRLYSDWAVVYERDPGTGLLSLVEAPVRPEVAVAAGGSSIVASPDDRHAYMGLSAFVNRPVLTWQRVDVACSPTPLATCRQQTKPGKGLVKIATKDARITWKWVLGAATEFADFGAPDVDDDYVLCVYDGSISPQPRLRALLPAGALCAAKECWRTQAGTGYGYADPWRTPEGVKKLRLLAGPDGRAKASLKAREVPGLSLPLQPPVTVQLQAENGTCWGAVYSSPLASDAGQFKARAD